VNFFPLVAICQQSKVKLCSTITTQNTAEKTVFFHTQETKLHFSRMYFYLSTVFAGHKQVAFGFLFRKQLQQQGQPQTPQSV
jgi:AAA15 family ATPase/GTPase